MFLFHLSLLARKVNRTGFEPPECHLWLCFSYEAVMLKYFHFISGVLINWWKKWVEKFGCLLQFIHWEVFKNVTTVLQFFSILREDERCAFCFRCVLFFDAPFVFDSPFVFVISPFFDLLHLLVPITSCTQCTKKIVFSSNLFWTLYST